jgi:hypothetical protein
MNLKQTQLHILHEAENLAPKAKTGVSLHCHTQYSKEMLDFIPHYAEKLPIISFFWKMERDKYLKREGKSIDFSTAFWSPPMSPHDVFRIEKEQINKAGLDAIVSISDHDSIDGTLELNRKILRRRSRLNGRCRSNTAFSTSASIICQRRAPSS